MTLIEVEMHLIECDPEHSHGLAKKKKKNSHLSHLLTAGVADEDMLDEFLVGRRQLDHGQSSTMDVRR